MDANLAMIFGFIMLLLFFVLPFAYAINKRQVEHEERKLELETRKAEAENGGGKNSADYRRLEERVRVLERIATDGNHQLAAQIEELRDLQSIDDRTPARPAGEKVAP